MTNEEFERERRLLEGTEQITEAVTGRADGHWMWRAGQECLWVSAGGLRLLGYPDPNVAPSSLRAWMQLVPEEERAHVATFAQSLLRSAGSASHQMCVVGGDGAKRWIRVYCRSHLNFAGEVEYLTGAVQEITALKQMEAQRDAERASLAALLETAVDAILTIDEKGVIETVNPATERLFGYGREELIGKNVRMLMPSPDHEQHDGYLRRYTRGGEPRIIGSGHETYARRRDGSVFPITLSVSEVVAGGRRTFAGIVRDTTHRVRNEESLRLSVAEMEEAKAMTERQAAELRQASEELAEARDAAIESTRLKSEFLATMSHEIRTPMNGVVGITDLLSRTPLTAEQQEYVRTIRSSGEALVAIINDILDFSKIEAGKMAFEEVEFDLWDAVDGVGSVLAEKALARGIDLNVQIGSGVPRTVLGDPGRLRQVVMNLAGNSLKFTHHGFVQIDVSLVGESVPDARVRFDVHDTGIGIAEDKLKALFQPFSQAEGGTTRRYGGTGLGLAICDRLVAQMGGQMEVTSQVGQGSSFSFEAPLKQAGAETCELRLRAATARAYVCAASPRLAAVLESYLSEAGVSVECVDSADALLERLGSAAGVAVVVVAVSPAIEGSEAAAENVLAACKRMDRPMIVVHPFGWRPPTVLTCPALTSPIHKSSFNTLVGQLFAKKRFVASVATEDAGVQANNEDGLNLRVLVADDNIVNRKTAQKMLQHIGCEVTLVENGQEAVDAAAAEPVDVILMDCHMPELDGYEATAAIRRKETGAERLPILALTASVLDEDRKRCFDADMDDVLPKPIALKELERALRHWCPEPRGAAETVDA